MVSLKTGMPLGPVDLDGFSLSIIFAISSGWVGERKNDLSSGLIINLLCLAVSGQ